jgi:hypothetical protein
MSKQTRRRFLANLGLGGAGAAAAALAIQAPAALERAGQHPAQEKPESRGYKVTEHVRKYYRTARV